MRYFILFYFILFYFILFYFILFYFILFYFILFFLLLFSQMSSTHIKNRSLIFILPSSINTTRSNGKQDKRHVVTFSILSFSRCYKRIIEESKDGQIRFVKKKKKTEKKILTPPPQ